jgi:hypothetical protein
MGFNSGLKGLNLRLMKSEASMAGVTQRIGFRVITLCMNVSSDVAEERRVYTFRLIFVQVETEVFSER